MFTKPSGTTEVKPLRPEIAARTGYDVDLHEPKANDSYESISQDYYNDRRLAPALQAFNKNKPLTGGGMIEVPPIYVLRKQFPKQASGTGTPAANSGSPPSTPQWSPVGSQKDAPARAPGGSRGAYTTEQTGMTMKDVARIKLGNEQRWSELSELNPTLLPHAPLPKGTELKLPANAQP